MIFQLLRKSAALLTIEDEEILFRVACRIPLTSTVSRVKFIEMCRRHDDYDAFIMFSRTDATCNGA
jgi:hypothetical protein